MARTIEDGPEPHDLLLEAIARESRDNRAAIDRLDTRFDRLEGHLDTRMDAFERRMEPFQHRMDAMQEDMNARFESVDARFNAVDARIDALRARTEQRFDRVDKWMENATAMMTKQDKLIMRLVILAEGTGGTNRSAPEKGTP